MTDTFLNNITDTNLKATTEDLYKSITDIFTKKNKKKAAFLIFNNTLNFIKIIMVITFICLAVYNTIKYDNVGIISSKPLLFFTESVLFGLTIFIPLLVFWYLRKTYIPFTTILSKASILGIVFIVLNYIIELSGLWDYMYGKKSKEQPINDKDQCKPKYKNVIYEIIDKFKEGNIKVKTFVIIVTALVGIPLLLMGISSLYISDLTPEYNFDKIPTSFMFILEMLLYGIISASPIFLVEYNRNNLSSHTQYDFGMQILKMCGLFIFFQISGLWGSMFKDTFGLEFEQHQDMCSKLDIHNRINISKDDIMYSCNIANTINMINQ